MKFTVTLKGDKELIARFNTMSETVATALEIKAKALGAKLEALVKAKLSGQVLNVGKNRPGHTGGQLRSSIQNRVERLGKAVMGTVFSAGDVRYGAIHEYGGTIKHPGGTPYFYDVKKQAIRFMSKQAADSIGFPVPTTAPHDIVMPERSFMRSSLREMAEEIQREFKLAAVEAIRKR